MQVGEGAGKQEQARVGDPSAAAQVETAQGRADGAQPSQAAVGHLLAEGEVDGGEGGEGGDEEAEQPLVGEAVAAAEVEVGEAGSKGICSCDQYSQAFLHAQHLTTIRYSTKGGCVISNAKHYLEPGDPSTMKTWNNEAVQAPQMETSLTPSPNVSCVHDVSPTLANLEHNPFIFHVHTQ